MSFSVVDKKFSIIVFLSMSDLFTKRISYQMLSPSLCSNSDWLLAFGQRCCCDIMFLRTKPASVKKAKASSSTNHSLPWCCTSGSWYFFLISSERLMLSSKLFWPILFLLKLLLRFFFVSMSFTLVPIPINNYNL